MKLPVKTAPRYIPPLLSKKKMFIFFSLNMIQAELNGDLEDFQTTNYRVPINHNAAHKSLYGHKVPPITII